MAKYHFDLDIGGLNELMRGGEMQSILDGYGAEVQSRAEGMAVDENAAYSRSIWVGNWIAKSVVRADNDEAMRENLKNNTLLKAL